jgi:hypothetical protein
MLLHFSVWKKTKRASIRTYIWFWQSDQKKIINCNIRMNNIRTYAGQDESVTARRLPRVSNNKIAERVEIGFPGPLSVSNSVLGTCGAVRFGSKCDGSRKTDPGGHRQASCRY